MFRLLSRSATRFAPSARSVHTEAKLAELGYTLPAVNPPKGSYVLATRSSDGKTLYTAGHLPQPADGELVTGKIGADLTVEEGNQAAQYAALSLLATLKNELGDLDKITRIVKVVGFVNCTDGFSQQPAVINGASDLFFEVLGDRGIHSRSAVGTNALPLNVAVEVECVVEVEGVEPNEKTKATMAQADQLIDQKHTTLLMKLIKTNKNDDAKQYFQMLQKSGQATVFHYNIAIAHLCSTSNEQRELISKMKTEGLVPDVATFRTLIKRLLYEGDKIAAQHVVDVEMPAEGVENEKTKAIMAQADQLD
jgi:enamine deaminase RidA (YjgF/YER057c/UK114 family)